MGLEVVLSSCVTGNKKTKTMPVLISTFKKVIFFLLQWAFVAAWAFSKRGKWGLLCSCGVQGSHCNLFFCSRGWALGHAAFNSCGVQTQLLHNMWDLPGPGIEPVSHALQG